MSSAKNGADCLIVEGKDDQYAIIHLTEKHGINWNEKSVRITISTSYRHLPAKYVIPKRHSHNRITIQFRRNALQVIACKLSDKTTTNKPPLPFYAHFFPDFDSVLHKYGDRRLNLMLIFAV
ncbi:DUF3226 domain-containing protein [Thioflexithrix psekupsensis]|uniref:DUF3226 domain-containing protein n=1 Tax=Thioflexithrix psekupsensis TaxID=1570016 RepID=UPI003CC9F789